MKDPRPLVSLSDDELLGRLADLVRESRRAEADLVAHIAEVDERKLFAREASPSMFTYCTEILHFSEAEAYLRIAAARASRKHPMLLAMLGDGRLHLTGVAKLAPHLTEESRDTLLKRATHMSKRQIEELLAELTPRPDAPALMRKLPERSMPPLQLRPDAVASPATELHLEELPPAAPRAVRPGPAPILPLAPDRYKVQFTATADLHDKLERLMALTRSSDLAAVIEQAVNEKLERLEARRFAKTKPRKGLAKADSSPYSRHIPAPVRRAVYERDGGQCRYVDKQGRRCVERSRLEYHHRRPFGLGGDRHSENICLMCRTHNQYLAECDYGRAVLEAARTRSRSTLRAVSP